MNTNTTQNAQWTNEDLGLSFGKPMATLPMQSVPRFPAEPEFALFEQLKHTDEYGSEYWLAREMQAPMEYAEWRNFEKVINKAREAARITASQHHFVDANNMVRIGSGVLREVSDVRMSRHGVNMVAMAADEGKPIIAAAKSYFSVMTYVGEKAMKGELPNQQPAAVITYSTSHTNEELGLSFGPALKELPSLPVRQDPRMLRWMRVADHARLNTGHWFQVHLAGFSVDHLDEAAKGIKYGKRQAFKSREFDALVIGEELYVQHREQLFELI